MAVQQSSQKSLVSFSQSLREALANAEHTRPEHCARLKQELAVYEQKYKISSAEVHQRIEDGLLEEDLDVCDWLMLLAMFDYECV